MLNKQNTEKVQNKKTRKINKKLLIAIIILIIIIATITTILIINNNTKQVNTEENETGTGLIDYNNTENAKVENDTKENTSSKLKEEKTYEGMKIKDITLSAQGTTTCLKAVVENTSGKNFKGKMVEIHLTNKDGSEFSISDAYIADVESGKTTKITAYTAADIANAYDFSIK